MAMGYAQFVMVQGGNQDAMLVVNLASVSNVVELARINRVTEISLADVTTQIEDVTSCEK